jgi:hypothetical protein
MGVIRAGIPKLWSADQWSVRRFQVVRESTFCLKIK